jgi:hypothetical protein
MKIFIFLCRAIPTRIRLSADHIIKHFRDAFQHVAWKFWFPILWIVVHVVVII